MRWCYSVQLLLCRMALKNNLPWLENEEKITLARAFAMFDQFLFLILIQSIIRLNFSILVYFEVVIVIIKA